MKFCVSTAAALWEIDELPTFSSEARADLDAAGIDSIFHTTLLSAGLDLETLRGQIQNCQYLASELKEAGITKPGDRIKILSALALWSKADA